MNFSPRSPESLRLSGFGHDGKMALAASRQLLISGLHGQEVTDSGSHHAELVIGRRHHHRIVGRLRRR